MSAEKEFLEAVSQTTTTDDKIKDEPKTAGEVDVLKTQISALSSELENLKTTNKILLEKLPIQGSSSAVSNDEDDDDEDFNADEPSSFKKLEQKIEQKLEAKFQARDNLNSWNAMANKDFDAYGFNDLNSRFYKEVNNELNRIPNWKNDPQSIYNACARTLSRGLNQGWVSKKQPEVIRDFRVANGGGASPTPGRGVSAEQIEVTPMAKTLMNAWGITEQKYKEVIANGGSTGARAARRALLA